MQRKKSIWRDLKLKAKKFEEEKWRFSFCVHFRGRWKLMRGICENTGHVTGVLNRLPTSLGVVRAKSIPVYCVAAEGGHSFTFISHFPTFSATYRRRGKNCRWISAYPLFADNAQVLENTIDNNYVSFSWRLLVGLLTFDHRA